jgi:hypothetical protein
MSCGSTGKQVSFRFMRQHRLQASATEKRNFIMNTGIGNNDNLIPKINIDISVF